MIIYSVSCVVDAASAKEWERFFVEKHLDDLVRTGYFTGYSFRKQIDSITQDKVTFTSEYFATDMSKIEQYQQTAAPILKQEVAEKFAGKYSCSRKIYEELINK